jgi:two-component system sensor histidine kinase CiaH
MLKQLRRKIIWMNVLLVGVVLFFVFTAVCINTYRASRIELESGLKMAMDMRWDDAGFKPSIGGPQRPARPAPPWLYLAVLVDSNGTVLSQSDETATIDSTVLAQSIKMALENPKNCDMLVSMNLMYYKNSLSQTTLILFADAGSVFHTLRNTVLICAALYAACLTVLFFISFWLSGIAVKPTEVAWNQQKQFISDASHELKTPLTVILANNSILMGHRQEPVHSQWQWLESTQEEAQHMKRLIDQMLMLAKSEEHHAITECTEISLSAIAEECALGFEPLAYEKGMALESQIEPALYVCADTTMLTQLIHILLDNAIKYGRKGTPVTLWLGRTGSSAVIRVHNYGVVIAPDDLDRIFDRFFRADKARGEGGHGLGLAIARNIVELLKGKIRVSSDAQSGTAFQVTLPLIHKKDTDIQQ